MPRADAAGRRVIAAPSRPPGLVALCRLSLLLGVLVARIQAALPPGAEDEIVLIEHLPGKTVHLQDFFWTGVEDAPSWVDPEQTLTLYETRTVHHTATVYVPEEPHARPKPGIEDDPSRRPVDCASCIDPTPTIAEDVDQNIGVLVGEDPGPRYWLLTVLKAGETVPPKVELRLAKLYKAAFIRQQQRHLGLLPESHTHRNSKRQAVIGNQTMIPDTTSEPPFINNTAVASASGPDRPQGIPLLRMRAVRIAKNKRTLPILGSEDLDELVPKALSLGEEPRARAANESADKSSLRRHQAESDVGLVQVRMQNTTQTEAGATRLIYTVHLGGRPVPAETAAKDMALLSAQEVALELGAPVLVQSEPYLKESRPLALSRKRDLWLLIGSASAGLVLLAAVLLGLLVYTKRKRAQSAIALPAGYGRGRRPLGRKDEEYAPTTTQPSGTEETAYTPETEGRTEATSGRRRTSPGTLSRSPGSQDTIEAVDGRENEAPNEQRRNGQAKPWNTRDYAEIAKRGMLTRRPERAIDRPGSGSSVESVMAGEEQIGGRPASFESLEKGFGPGIREASGSPHSYLSMPSCKQFPNMRSVEPLAKVLEPVLVKHLDLELDSPELKEKDYNFSRENSNHYFSRSSSAIKDPGVLGPIVWDLKRKRAIEGEEGGVPAPPAEVDLLEAGRPANGAVGRARRKLNELFEDSLHLFGARESRRRRRHRQNRGRPETGAPAGRGAALGPEHRTSGGALWERLAPQLDDGGEPARVSPAASPTPSDVHRRARASLPANGPPPPPQPSDPSIAETGTEDAQPRGAWGSRPLSAGPFHRPVLPRVEVARVLADSQLGPEDPAVPLIAAIKRELGKLAHD